MSNHGYVIRKLRGQSAFGLYKDGVLLYIGLSRLECVAHMNGLA